MRARVLIWATGETRVMCQCTADKPRSPGALAVLTDGTLRWVTCPVCLRSWNADGAGSLTRPPLFTSEVDVPGTGLAVDPLPAFIRWRDEHPRQFLAGTFGGSRAKQTEDLSRRMWSAFEAGWKAGRVALRAELEQRLARSEKEAR